MEELRRVLMERIEMSVQEVKRLEVLRQVSDGVLTQAMAAEVLGG